MNTSNADTTQPPHVETEAERLDRLAWEAEGIAEARAELNAGLYVDANQMHAWINSLRTDAPPPPPPTRPLESGGVPRRLIYAPRARDDINDACDWLTQN